MKTASRIAVSVALALALIALLMRWTGTDAGEVAGALRSLDPGLYLAALGVQALIYPLRALRFRALLPAARRPPVVRLVPVTAAHILAANVLPAKLGEATLVLYLQRAASVPAAHGFAVLLVSRLLDFATVAGSLAVACLALGAAGAFPDLPWLTGLGLALLLPALGFAWLGLQSERLVVLSAAALRLTKLDRTRVGAWTLRLAERLRAALAEQTPRHLLAGAAASVPVWLCVFVFYALLARGLGVQDLGLAEATFGAGLAILANLLPVNGFGGFGVQDVGWVAGFTALGVPAELATSSGLAAHLIYLFHISLFGLAGHVAMGVLSRPATPAPGP